MPHYTLPDIDLNLEPGIVAYVFSRQTNRGD